MEALPVTEVEFWRMRLVMAHVTGRGLHSAVYDTDPETWNRIQNDSVGILKRHLKPRMSLLDAGCAYGPIYDILPPWVNYTGIDISPDFIEIARLRHPKGNFKVGDLRFLPEFKDKQFDFSICRSVEGMIVDNCGDSLWEVIKTELLRVSSKVILFGYDPGHREIILQ